MTYARFTQDALSEWMRGEGPDSDVVISSRVRLARNLQDIPFPMLATNTQLQEVMDRVAGIIKSGDLQKIATFTPIPMSDLSELERKVLVEKHLISPHMDNQSSNGAVILNDSESVSIMVNEEDHLRIQVLSSGFQVREAWELAGQLDDVFEAHLDYGYDEKKGYLTSCPTNVGTGIRASVMMHLPALVLTQQINRILSAVTQVGLAVRGLYGEGSEALGNVFQISNQITLGQTEEEIINNLHSVARQIIEHERTERRKLMEGNKTRLIDRVSRSLGILSYAAIIDSKEAAQRISDVRLGVDSGIIKNVSATVLNELLVMTQPGFLQQHAKSKLSADERDIRRAQIIRERMRGEGK